MSHAVTVLVLLLSPVFSAAGPGDESLVDTLTAARWRQLDSALDRALRWLSTQQRADDSFAAPAAAQPAVTSFVVLAMLSDGHLPG